ncbi:hypothetical protein HY086_06560 [Candidatus Gottesmanbacteria bacterium]|nr:hypothetical protein [Candidatus Gottesmanbacteria bacterium]
MKIHKTRSNQKATKIRQNEEQDFLYDVHKITKSRFVQTQEIKKIKPLYHSNGVVCKLREDKVTKSLEIEAVFQNAKLKTNGYFVSINPIIHYEK